MFLFCLMSTIQSEQSVHKIDSRELETIIAAIAQDDRCALEQFYKLTDKMLYGFILSILKNPYDAEDVMQDTYLKIRAGAHLYQSKGKPMAWVFTIARNLCLMRLRSQKQHGETSYELLEFGIASEESNMVEDRIVLQKVLQLLDENERQIVILHAVNGMKHREIASILGMPIATVLSKYARSIVKLKKMLNIELGGIDHEKERNSRAH